MSLPDTYDALFRRHAGAVPVAYLRALAKRESNLNPNAANTAAVGLLQITSIARVDHNQRAGTSYSRANLYDPEINVEIGAGLLNRIVRAYAKHPSANLRTDWSNPEFVKLLTAGWNSGYSEGGGVGKVASYLEARGLEVTHDSVFEHSAAAGATSHLRNSHKQSWQRGVASLYFQQPDAGQVSVLGALSAAFPFAFVSRIEAAPTAVKVGVAMVAAAIAAWVIGS
jgi:soluble lytic murein transglycosylase-like protein